MAAEERLPAWLDVDVEIEWTASASNVLAIVAGAVLLRYAFTIWSLFIPGPATTVASVLLVVATATGLLLVGVAEVDVGTHGRAIATFVLGVIVASALLVYVGGIEIQYPGPDALLFGRYGADLLLDGANPFAASMAPAWSQFGTTPLSQTPTMDGGRVTSWSYPAGSLLAFVPATGLGLEAGVTTGVATLAMLAYQTLRANATFALAPAVVILGLAFVHGSFLGLTDAIWMLPTVVAMTAWHDGRDRRAAVAMGVACAVKQLPWLICPFLAIWVWRAAPSGRAALRRAGRLVAWGGGTFLAINAPFILWNPQAWLTSVLTPVGSTATLVHQGVGLTLLTVSGVVALPTWTFVGLVASATVAALVCYACYWERLRWAAWVLPVAILFVHYRSLFSYFMAFAVVGLWAGLCARDELANWPRPREVVGHVS